MKQGLPYYISDLGGKQPPSVLNKVSETKDRIVKIIHCGLTSTAKCSAGCNENGVLRVSVSL